MFYIISLIMSIIGAVLCIVYIELRIRDKIEETIFDNTIIIWLIGFYMVGLYSLFEIIGLK